MILIILKKSRDRKDKDELAKQRSKDNTKWKEKIGKDILNQRRNRKYAQKKIDQLMNTTEKNRRQKFTQGTLKGPIFICNCCKQRMYEKSVSEVTEALLQKVTAKNDSLLQCLTGNKAQVFRSTSPVLYICSTCRCTLSSGKLPAMAESNKLILTPIPVHCQLTELENNLIARTINFQKIILMKKSRWAARRGRMVSVPIPPDEMMKTINQFPRLPSEAGLIAVKLKRKKQYTGHEKHEMINPEKIIKALIHLKEAGHQSYLDVNIDKNFIERCQNEDK